jgi:glutamate formiminotransferase
LKTIAAKHSAFLSVPNFSEGRDQEVVAALGAGEDVIDVHADPLHNRTVVTMARADVSVLAASVLAKVALAAARIDLGRHSGLHPRVGAADVVPIVPLGCATLAEAAAAAASLGRSIWESLQVPVWFYGPAFGDRRLADIRRGRAGPPDLGGPALHPSAGAVCVGARPPLVAYNLVFEGLSLPALRSVARAMRSLPGVQALGFTLPDSRAQLSLNLTAPLELGVAEAYAVACRLAGQPGRPELVGLCPARAAGPGCDGAILEARLAACAARRGVAAAAVSAASTELRLLAERLAAEASALAALDAAGESILGGAERTAALIRVLRAGGVSSAESEALLDIAARGLRAAVDPATAERFGERARLLDQWLDLG